jgi:VWFA-related protein
MRGFVLAACLVSTPLALAAQQQPAPPDLPTFRSGVDLVTIDATIVADDGSPVEGLRASDFELKVDGKPRTVASAEFVAIVAGSRDEETVTRPSHYSTNEHAPSGRSIVFVVDQEHIRSAEGMPALRAAGRFMDSLRRDDRVAVTGIPRLGAMLDLTTDHHAARRELERLVGQSMAVPAYFNIGLYEALQIGEGSRQDLDTVVRRECGTTLSQSENPARTSTPDTERDPCPVQVEQEARALAQYARNQARNSLEAIGGIVESLKAIDDHKTIILVSEGLVAQPRYVDFSGLAAAAAAARVTIHVLQLETPVVADASQERVSPTTLRDRSLREDGLVRLAGAGRGAVFPFIGDGSVPFAKIGRELSGYYLLGFEAASSDRDGRVHRIDLKLRGRRANVRARQAFTAAQQPARERAVAQQLAGLLRSPRLATELPLRVSTYTYQEPGSSRLRVVVSAQAGAEQDGSPATLAFVLLDTSSVIAASATHVAAQGRHAFSTVVPPGDYTLKVAGIDPLGRRGSVERGFGARLGDAGSLQVSDLLIADPPASPADPLEPMIDGTGHDELVAYLELYSDVGTTLRQASVRIEVANTESGPSFVTVPALLNRRDARWAIARAQVPTTSLPPGRYVIRAQIYVDGQPVKRLARPFGVEK